VGHRDRTTVAGPVPSRMHRNLMYKEPQVDPRTFSTFAPRSRNNSTAYSGQ